MAKIYHWSKWNILRETEELVRYFESKNLVFLSKNMSSSRFFERRYFEGGGGGGVRRSEEEEE